MIRLKTHSLFITLSIWICVSIVCVNGQNESSSAIKNNYKVEWIDLKIKSEHPFYFNDAIEDSKGYIWAASIEGLICYDGHSQSKYAYGDDLFSLSVDSLSNQLGILVKDTQGNICTYDKKIPKLIQFNPIERTQGKTFALKDSYSIIRSSFEITNSDEIFMVGYNLKTKAYNVNKYEEDSIRAIFSWQFEAEEDELFYSMKIVNDQLFILTRHFLYELTHDGKLINKVENNTEEVSMYNLYTDGSQLYASNGMNTVMLRYTESGQLINEHIEFPGTSHESTNLLIEEDRMIFCSPDELFIYFIETKEWVSLTEQYLNIKKKNSPTTLTKGIVKVMRLENGDYLIVGESSLLLLKESSIDNTDFRVEIKDESTDLSMRELVKTATGDIYASYYGGLAIKKKGNDHFLPIKIKYLNDEKMKAAFSLAQWRDKIFYNSMQLNTNYEASRTFENVAFNHSENIIINDTLYSYLWYSGGKMCVYDLKSGSKNIVKLLQQNGKRFKPSYINKLIEDQNSNHMWIIDPETKLSLMSKKGEIVKNVDCIQKAVNKEDLELCDIIQEDSLLWIGAYSGLIKVHIENDEMEVFSHQSAFWGEVFSNNIIYSIVPVDASRLLLGTDKGLLLFDKKTELFSELIDDHPLKEIEYNRNSTLKDGEQIYMGSAAGLYSFTMDELIWQTEVVPSAIDFYSLSSKSTKGNKYYQGYSSLKEDIELSPTDKNIELRYSSPSLNKDIFYAYRIPTIDSLWSDYTKENTLKLYSLPAGHHTIEISAKHNLNTTRNRTASFQIFQDEVWYKKWWAILVYGLSLIGIGYSIYLYRLNQLTKYQELRTRISSDLHDDVGTLLSSVAMQSEVLGLGAPPEKQERFEKLSSLSREAMGRMRDTVWAIDSRKDNVDSLVDRMQDYLSDISEGGKFKVNFDHSQSKLSSSIAPDIRQNAYLIFKEAVNNAFKYSNGNELDITLISKGNNLTLTVRDNGQIDASKIKTSGMGLANMKMRAKRIGGELSIRHQEGFIVVLTIKK